MSGEVASRYARAFAQAAESAGLDSAKVQLQMEEFSETVAGSGALRDFLVNPSVAMPQKLKVLDAISARMGLAREVRNLVAVVLEHQRLGEWDEIRAEYRELSDERAGAVEATITSARPLDPEQRAELEANVARVAGGRVRASYVEDPSLLGGAVVQVGSTIYDGSVRAQLRQLKQKLVNA